jgi:Zn-dependent peptidase ImmA (M78 family)/DNA-binding XRE family transcriptional regulator
MPADPLDAANPVELGARLREARSARGWTQEEAAEALGVARTTMVAIEKGERRLKPDELIRLAQLYGRKLSALLRPGAPVEDVSVQLRGALPPPAEAPSEADLLPHIHELERLCDDSLELERLLGAPLPRRDPPVYALEGIDPEQLAEDVATAERNRLGLGDAPVLNLRAVLEGDVGLRIFYLDLPSTVAGMFAFTEEHGGALAINRNHPPERRRCSLAHEYGHYLTDRYRAEITILGRYERRPPSERFAETFARAFLMPAAGLRRRYHELARQRSLEGRGGPTPGDLCYLAHFYFVSFEAVTLRLEELGLVRAGTWQRLSQQGFRVKQARLLLGLQEHPVEDELLPSRYRYLAVEAWHRGELSEGQLAAFLRVDRLSARRLVREMGLQHQEGGDGDGSADLFLPLAAGELR